MKKNIIKLALSEAMFSFMNFGLADGNPYADGYYQDTNPCADRYVQDKGIFENNLK